LVPSFFSAWVGDPGVAELVTPVPPVEDCAVPGGEAGADDVEEGAVEAGALDCAFGSGLSPQPAARPSVAATISDNGRNLMRTLL
jgi:hypothetical protein